MVNASRIWVMFSRYFQVVSRNKFLVFLFCFVFFLFSNFNPEWKYVLMLLLTLSFHGNFSTIVLGSSMWSQLLGSSLACCHSQVLSPFHTGDTFFLSIKTHSSGLFLFQWPFLLRPLWSFLYSSVKYLFLALFLCTQKSPNMSLQVTDF